MKNISKLMFLSSLLIALCWSCKKDEIKDYLEAGTSPVLTASVTAINLFFPDSAKEAIKLNWTNPNYKFTTGVSSQDVSYLIEIDKAGSNFTNPQKQTVAVNKELSISFTVAKFNDYLLNQLQLTPGVEAALELRVIASLGANRAVPFTSNVIAVTATPYSIPPKVAPPTEGTLWMTGDATYSGWANPLGEPYDQSQQFTMISPTLYEITLSLPGGGAYKLIQQQGVWGTQYHMLTGGTWDKGDFEKKDSDPGFPGPPASGTYKISVDFQRGKYTVTKQ